ncbi:MAG: DNA-3-methyladenine glycosylase 2 family protein [Syntrophaceae bacterium]|nr:DNA-3-methyladenine glycosylase 2 family protein [Syntrophaceae bacterium]
MAKLCIRLFSLKHTLECGQFFRFTKALDTYMVQSSDRIFSVHQKGDSLFYEGVEETFLIQFFRLDENLDFIYKEIDQDPVIHQAIKKYQGMRLIRQDPWECLLSFLFSSAKAISHIRSMIEVLCRSTGKRVIWGNYLGYGFPEPCHIETPLQLQSVKAGFRINYLIGVSRCMDRGQLLALKKLPYGEARKQLMSLSGVGKKVADCMLLYSLDFLEAFPMDTWIKRGLQQFYFNGNKVGEKAMEEFVSKQFGPYAGYAQLYLYHFWRHHPLLRNRQTSIPKTQVPNKF